MTNPNTSSTDLFTRVLDQLRPPLEEAPAPAVDEARLTDAARRMTRRGYNLSKNPLAALKAYLEGKSLLLAGTVGTGKTLFFRTLCEAGLVPGGMVLFSLRGHALQRLDEMVREMRGHNDREVLIDDVGAESKSREFGNQVEVLATLMDVREDSPRRTHYTTNLTSRQFEARYGDRVMSRIRTCESFVFAGRDRRTAKANKQIADHLRKCRDPRSWQLCLERCSAYRGDCVCGLGKTVPPPLEVAPGSPEDLCGVGTTIPYCPRHYEDLRQERELRERMRNEVKVKGEGEGGEA